MSGDFRFALRQFFRNKTFSVIAILVLSLAIAANILVFSLVHPVLFEPLPFPEPNQLVHLLHVENGGRTQGRVSEAQAQVILREATTFKASAVTNMGLSITDSEQPLNPLMRRASEGHFELLGVEPLLGRTFSPDEHIGDGARVAILHEGFWHSYYGGESDVIGRTIELADEPYEIIGVVPASHIHPLFPQSPVLWLPFGESVSSTRPSITVIGRMLDGSSRKDVNRELEVLSATIAEIHPDAFTGSRLQAESLHSSIVAPMRPSLILLLVAVGLVLLVACGNIANLLLARAVTRRQEIAVRLALGAGKMQLARQLLVEGLLLALAGSALGLLLATWALGPLLAMAPVNTPVPLLERISIDTEITLFALTLALVTSLIFGFFPLTQVRSNLATRLSAGASRSVGGSGRIRRALVVAEIALSALLLITAGLTLRSLMNWRALSPGFEPAGLVSGRTGARGPGFDTPDRYEIFHQQALDRVREISGVEKVAACQFLPMFGSVFGSTTPITRDPEAVLEKWPRSVVVTTTPGFFEVFGQPVLAGRDFTELDRSDTPAVAVISRDVESRLWGELGSSINQEVWLDEDGARSAIRIVGVVGDLRGLTNAPEPGPILYRPLAQNPTSNLTYVFRTPLSIDQLQPAVEQAIWTTLSRDVPVYSFREIPQLLSDIEWQPRFMMQLLSAFAGLALIMAATGLYGVLAYAVAERRREIGLRMAVGAGRWQIVQMVQTDAVKLGGLGLGLGLLGALAAGAGLENILIGVSAFDIATYSVVFLLLGSVVVLASLFPAWRASRVDPIKALRMD